MKILQVFETYLWTFKIPTKIYRYSWYASNLSKHLHVRQAVVVRDLRHHNTTTSTNIYQSHCAIYRKRLSPLDKVRLGVEAKTFEYIWQNTKRRSTNNFRYSGEWVSFLLMWLLYDRNYNFEILYPGLVQRFFFLVEVWKFHPQGLHLRDIFSWKESSYSLLSATTGHMSKTSGISGDYIE